MKDDAFYLDFKTNLDDVERYVYNLEIFNYDECERSDLFNRSEFPYNYE